MEIIVKLKTKSKVDDGLLMTGVPFEQGAMQKDQSMILMHEKTQLPIWWDERSYWPDGSVKWVFIHTRVPKGENMLLLMTDPKKAEIGNEKVVFTGDHLRAGNCNLNFSRGEWSFQNPDGVVSLVSDRTVTDLTPAYDHTDNLIELLEDSDIAPLIRIRPPAHKKGFITEQLFRIDIKGKRLIWMRRMIWNAEGKYILNSAEADLRIECRNGVDKFQSGSLLIPEPGTFTINGETAYGNPEGRVDIKGISLWVEKAWQRAPLGLEWGGNNIRLSFFPEVVKSLGVMGGTAFRHTVHLCFGDMAHQLAGHEVEVVIDPGYICNTRALGLIIPSYSNNEILWENSINNFPGFDNALRVVLDSGRLSRLADNSFGDGLPVPLEDEPTQDKAYFGLNHYGDWPMPWGSYGMSTRRMYASNEYDPAYAYYQGYAIFGDWRYFEIARQSAIHMTDVDIIHTTGDMRYHGYNETAEDHEYLRTTSGDFGHYWTDGFWALYFLSGDIWAKEAAQRLTFLIMNRFLRGGTDFMRRLWSGAERTLGWPIVAAIATFEATGNIELLDMIKRVAEFICAYTSEPDKQVEEEKGTQENPLVWWRTALQDGCKPFMLGVIMEGLERYHRETKDPAAAESILRLAGFITENMWLVHQANFIYEWNGYGSAHRMSRPHHLIPLFVRGIGYAYEISGKKEFLDVSEKAFYSCLWTLYDPKGGGKSIGMTGRTLGAFVAMAEGWIKRDQIRYIKSLDESLGKEFRWDSVRDGDIKELMLSKNIILSNGSPEYVGAALVSSEESYIEGRFKEPVFSDSGEITFRVKLDKCSSTWRNQRCYIHLCDEIHTRSCISIITFYTSLHVRIYDANRRLIDVAEGYIKDIDANGKPVIKTATPIWEEEEWHTVSLRWESPGEVVLIMDGIEADRRVLDKPIGGCFTRINIGHKPGNWRANGQIELIKLDFSKNKT